MEVHKQLENGFQEVIYQRALAIEFSLQGMSYARELEMELPYTDENIANRRADY